MAKVKIMALCGGTQILKSKKGNDYTATKFIDTATLQPILVFGDLGLPVDNTPREYEFDCSINTISNVTHVAGMKPASK